jgi:predicted P-loop ATPase
MAEVVNLQGSRQVSALNGMLAKTDKLQVISNVSNIILIIGHDPVLSGLCGFDEFQCMPIIHEPAPSPIEGSPPLPGPYPRSWGSADVSQIQAYIQRVWISTARKGDVEDAMFAVASSRRFHPVKDWLKSLNWDFKPRLNQWLKKTFGVEDNDYHNDVSSCILIAAVRRVIQPGIKFDHMPVLEGAQGMGKSTAIKTLFGHDWFTDTLPAALESKDAAQGVQGVWCIEFAEIEQLIRNEVEVIKSFLSRSVERFRAPYGKSYMTYPRQCVMIGTTNDTDYLRDATGNRRFWPIKCEFVDLEWLKENREQIWAEAAYRESCGEDHWLQEVDSLSQARIAQEDRQQEDVWEDKIRTYLSGMYETTTGDVLTLALFVPLEKQEKRQQMRVAAILKKMRWERKVVRNGDTTSKKWVFSI